MTDQDGELGDDRRISRRSLLIGAAGAVVVVGGAAGAADYELGRHPGLRRRLFGCGSTPPIPRSDYAMHHGTMHSAAMSAAMPWALAMPRTGRRKGLPLVLALPGEGGQASDFATKIGIPGFATAVGLRACFVSPGDVGSIYYHPRTDGTNYFRFMTEELIPMVERRFAVGGSRSNRAVYGLSMGGFGSLLVAQRRPDLVCAAVGSSPAVFPSYDAAITGHPATFDSAADWQEWGLWNQTGSMGEVRVRIDCGNEDPFGPTASDLLTRIRGAVGNVGSGRHDDAFWRTNATEQLRFLASHF
jgi:pimeloyl-ACP methyl ester carboxylesterase